VRSSNPVLTRLTPETMSGSRAGYPQQQGYPAQPSVITPATTDRMTIDDVVVRTVGLLAIVGVVGAVAWSIVPLLPAGLVLPLWIGAALIGLGLGLYISIKRVTNPAVIAVYAVVEGTFVGVISKFYESRFEGIVVQAVVGTFGLFFLMALLYKLKVLRATPRFTKMIIGAMIGIFALYAVNFLVTIFGGNLGIFNGGPVSIIISLVIIAVASLSFVLDFAQVEEGVRQGLPKQYAWLCAFGILVGLVWLYLEILRLLGYLRGSD
jgi:uncharacterized YccA/Bax inhibitor family protein